QSKKLASGLPMLSQHTRLGELYVVDIRPCNRPDWSPCLPLERPQIEKPDGDIPFDLGVEDIVVGDGDEAVKGKKVSVHYVGVSFSTGEEFDASWNSGQPFEFKLGKGQAIPAWDAGVPAMQL